MAPAARCTRVASSFRARAAYPAPTSEASPRLLVALGAAADVSASGDLFITFPTFDDLVPTPNVVMGMLTQHQPPHYPTQPGPRHAPASSLLTLALLAGGAPIIIAGPPASSACDGTRHLVIFGAYVHTRRPGTTRSRPARLASLPRRHDGTSGPRPRDSTRSSPGPNDGHRHSGAVECDVRLRSAARVGRSGVTRSDPRPNGGHKHGRDFRV